MKVLEKSLNFISSGLYEPCICLKRHLLWSYWVNFNETMNRASPMGRDYNLYKWRALVHWVHFGQAEQMCNCVYIAICLKRHLLWSYWANFNETWQKVSPGGRDYYLYKWRALVHFGHFGQAEEMCNCT